MSTAQGSLVDLVVNGRTKRPDTLAKVYCCGDLPMFSGASSSRVPTVSNLYSTMSCRDAFVIQRWYIIRRETRPLNCRDLRFGRPSRAVGLQVKFYRGRPGLALSCVPMYNLEHLGTYYVST